MRPTTYPYIPCSLFSPNFPDPIGFIIHHSLLKSTVGRRDASPGGFSAPRKCAGESGELQPARGGGVWGSFPHLKGPEKSLVLSTMDIGYERMMGVNPMIHGHMEIKWVRENDGRVPFS